MADKYHKIGWCPICNQGWIEIVKEKKTGALFLCCDECGGEWANPDDIGNRGTRDKFGQVTEPTISEIRAKGWEKYIIEEIP